METLVSVETTIDDMSPQLYEPLLERLLAAGALDVYLTPVIMKRSRPGTVLSALAPPELADRLADVLFRETTTIGVRWSEVRRRRLPREMVRLATAFGPVTFKVSTLGGRIVTVTPEFEEVRRIADARGTDRSARCWRPCARRGSGRSRPTRPLERRARTERPASGRADEEGATDDGDPGHGGAGLHRGERRARDDVSGRRPPAAARPLVDAGRRRDRDPASALARGRCALGAMAGWLLWVGGLAVQVAGFFDQVGVARW